MNLIIYPDPNKVLNVNERQFITIAKYISGPKYILIEDTKIESLEKSIKEIKDKNLDIKTITILIDNYATFIYNNLDTILKNKNIIFFIHENDLHKSRDRLEIFNRYYALRKELKNNHHIKILAYYWYDYQRRYEIPNKNLICFPKFAHSHDVQEINKNPINKILLSGAISRAYPMRQYVLNLNNPNVDVLNLKDKIKGSDYVRYIGNYLCCFTCCLNGKMPYLINKFFEIPCSGSLLLAYDELVVEPMKELGFIDGENYISCNKKNLVEKINWICDEKNREEIDRIRLNGLNLIKERHTDYHRYKFLKEIIEENN